MPASTGGSLSTGTAAAGFNRQWVLAEQQMAQWLAGGRMRYQEDVLHGLEQMPRALIRLYEGRNSASRSCSSRAGAPVDQ